MHETGKRLTDFVLAPSNLLEALPTAGTTCFNQKPTSCQEACAPFSTPESPGSIHQKPTSCQEHYLEFGGCTLMLPLLLLLLLLLLPLLLLDLLLLAIRCFSAAIRIEAAEVPPLVGLQRLYPG